MVKEYLVMSKATVRVAPHKKSKKLGEFKKNEVIKSIRETTEGGIEYVYTEYKGKNGYVKKKTSKGEILLEELDDLSQELFEDNMKAMKATTKQMQRQMDKTNKQMQADFTAEELEELEKELEGLSGGRRRRKRKNKKSKKKSKRKKSKTKRR